MELSKATLEQLFHYSDGHIYWKKGSRNGLTPGVKAGCYHSSGYRVVKIYGKRYKVHRIIFILHHDFNPTHIDHIDGDTLNNKIENLRVCTHNQNMHNRKISKNSKSGIKGITWVSSCKKWWSQLMVNSKRIKLGMYEDLELAELVIQEAREKYHRDFLRN